MYRKYLKYRNLPGFSNRFQNISLLSKVLCLGVKEVCMSQIPLSQFLIHSICFKFQIAISLKLVKFLLICKIFIRLWRQKIQNYLTFFSCHSCKLQSPGCQISFTTISKIEKCEEFYFETQKYLPFLLFTKWQLLKNRNCIHYIPNWVWFFPIGNKVPTFAYQTQMMR